MNADAAPSKPEVGDLLLQQGRLTPRQLEQAQRRQRRLGVPQHRAIVDLNCASEEDTYRALARLHELEFVDLCNLTVPKPLLELVPMSVIFRHRVIPCALEADLLTLAFCEPPGSIQLGDLRLRLAKRLKPVLTTPSCYHAVTRRSYGLGAETIQRLREERGFADDDQEIVFDVKTPAETSADDTVIAEYVDEILLEALRLQATDIHIEPYPTSIRLRYRIDGVLQPVEVPDRLRQVYGAIISRLKIMAGLNIAEKRLPHDGRIAMKTSVHSGLEDRKEEYDLRVSIVPTKHGEAACLRILGRQSLFLDLGQLGMEPDQEALMRELTALPQGMVLLTGPTGSGKTTTLYATLAHAEDDGRKIITIEDPIEYQLRGITQIQSRDDIGLSFSAGLRSVLRHDPDVVLIGEIRDAETAEIAVRAAQTGHLVFSTLHTNDSLSAITRLLEMGIEPFLVGSSLVCSIAQRLAQRVCLHCGTKDLKIPDAVRNEMAQVLKLPPAEIHAFKGCGCVECNQKGYRGRVAIYEFFVLTEDIADLLGPALQSGQLRALARKHGWQPLRDLCWAKVQAGLVPVSETVRLTRRLKLGSSNARLA